MDKRIMMMVSLMLMSVVALSGCTDFNFNPVPPNGGGNGDQDQWTFVDDDILTITVDPSDIDSSMKIGDTGHEMILITIHTHGVTVELRLDDVSLGRESLSTTKPTCEFGIDGDAYMVEFIDATDNSATFKLYKKE